MAATNKELTPRKRARLGNTQSDRIDYSPTIFLRCHSRNNDAADKQTRVWQCAFAPIPVNSQHKSTVFATCGGNSVCVIDAENGFVETKHYSKDSNEDFTAVAWTTLLTVDGVINILAVAGAKSVLHLLHPDRPVCFVEYRLKKMSLSKGDSVESLIFHPKQTSILFCAFKQGAVLVYDIGKPEPPEYKTDIKLLLELHTARKLNNNCASALTFSAHCNMLLCATEKGVVGWLIPTTGIKEKVQLKQQVFNFPSPSENVSPEEINFVDSVEAIGDGAMIATKCVLHGAIYIWNLEEMLKHPYKKKVQPIHTLTWSTTDDYYMNIGINAKANILGCGDDKGNLWLYNIEEILQLPSQEHECNRIIEWPIVEDSEDVKRKKIYNSTNIVVNKVAFSYDANVLVAVTNTNTVCIWKKDH